VVGTNHRQAPVDFRERVSFAGPEMDGFLRQAHERLQHADCFMFSTCNRTEIYAFQADASTGRAACGAPRPGEGGGCKPRGQPLYEYHGRSAMEQLFRVACGLDSLMLGEARSSTR